MLTFCMVDYKIRNDCVEQPYMYYTETTNSLYVLYASYIDRNNTTTQNSQRLLNNVMLYITGSEWTFCVYL